LVNKYSIDTDVPSNLSVRAEVAFLKPDSPKSGSDFRTAHVDDFEGSQTTVTAYPLSWSLASRRLNTSSNMILMQVPDLSVQQSKTSLVFY
jgi:cell surface protein SprA